VSLQSEDVLSRAERINELINTWKLQVSSRSSQVAVEVVQRLAVNPYFTIHTMAKELGVAYSTVHRAVQKLEQAGIINEISANKRDRIYCAVEILRILEEPTKIKPNDNLK
jgi:Fic family protein